MIRKFNYTNRKKIPLRNIDINLHRNRGTTYFDADILLKDVEVDESADIILEAFDRGSYQRFNWGTVGRPVSPTADNRKLTEIQEAELVTFRVKVIDNSGIVGKILAVTKPISVWAEEVEEVRKGSLLPVTRGPIGDSIWEINFDVEVGDVPKLIVNDKFDEVAIKGMLKTDTFFTTLIYPAALSAFLTRIITIDEIKTSDGDIWENLWLQFTLQLPGIDPIPEEKNKIKENEWIKSAVSLFCRQNNMLDSLSKKIGDDKL